MFRFLIGVVGTGALFAMMHKTIMAGDGYDHGDVDAIAATALVMFMALAVVPIFRAGHLVVGFAIIAALVAGDVARFGRTFAEEMDRMTTLQAPATAATKRQEHAKGNLTEALVALAAIGSTTPRIEAAKLAKADTEKGVREKTSERGCRKGCTAQLALQMRSANDEFKASRDELRARRQSAETRVAQARTALASVAVPPSVSPAADLIGWSAAAFNAALAGLKSVALNLGAIAMLAVAGHGLKLSRAPEPKPEPAQIAEPINEQIARFALDRYAPDAQGQIHLADAYREYLQWCKRANLQLVSMPDFITEFDRLAARARLTVDRDHANQIIVRGMSSTKLIEGEAA